MIKSCRGKRFYLDQCGSSIIEVLVAFVILIVITISLFQMSLYFKTRLSADKVTDSSAQIIAATIQNFRKDDFMELLKYCMDKNVLGNSLQSGRCIDSNRIKIPGSPDPRDVKYGLEQPVDSNGNLATGIDVQSCTEIVMCKPIISGHVLEISFAQYIYNPTDHKFSSRTRNFRRSRW